jgi:hypothetical protein
MMPSPSTCTVQDPRIKGPVSTLQLHKKANKVCDWSA